MGILTSIASTYDEEDQVQRIFAVTRFSINNRSSLNRVAGRAAVETGAGQRTLVAAAYDEVGLDMVWREGPFSVISPEEKWPDAQDIEFHSVEMVRSSSFFDITDIPERAVPRGSLTDRLIEGIPVFDEENVIYIWEVPFDIGGRRV